MASSGFERSFGATPQRSSVERQAASKPVHDPLDTMRQRLAKLSQRIDAEKALHSDDGLALWR